MSPINDPQGLWLGTEKKMEAVERPSVANNVTHSQTAMSPNFLIF